VIVARGDTSVFLFPSSATRMSDENSLSFHFSASPRDFALDERRNISRAKRQQPPADARVAKKLANWRKRRCVVSRGSFCFLSPPLLHPLSLSLSLSLSFALRLDRATNEQRKGQQKEKGKSSRATKSGNTASNASVFFRPSPNIASITAGTSLADEILGENSLLSSRVRASHALVPRIPEREEKTYGDGSPKGSARSLPIASLYARCVIAQRSHRSAIRMRRNQRFASRCEMLRSGQKTARDSPRSIGERRCRGSRSLERSR